jgi:hypothetical protein
MDSWTTLAVYDDVNEANLARAALEGAGFSCFLTNEFSVGLGMTLGRMDLRIELRVLSHEAEAAVKVLTGEDAPVPNLEDC